MYQCAPLHYAAARGDVEMISQLLTAGADPNRKGDTARSADATPLHVAAKADSDVAVAALLEGGALANATLAAPPFGSSETPLHIAAWRGFNSVVRVLLRHGADVNATSAEGMTAIDFAEERGHLDIVRELEEWGAVQSDTARPETKPPRMNIILGIPGMDGGVGGTEGLSGFAERLFGGAPKEESRFKRANSTTKFADVAG
jgi:ankyrin repeat protein